MRRQRASFQQQLNAWERSIQSRRSGAGRGLKGGAGLGPGQTGKQAPQSGSTYLQQMESAAEAPQEETGPGKPRVKGRAKQRARQNARLTPQQRLRRQAKRKGRTVQSQKRINKVTKVAKKVQKRHAAKGKQLKMKQARTRARRIIRKRRRR